ncbi:MAG: DUF1028 domain-containing protein [Bacteroidia bacterium]|nr:DUF1028 domain-containing protein [Bacteroidia bacterium]
MKIFKIYLLFLCIGICSLEYGYSQDTFSIVAVDSVTGEVGSAGASCVDLFNFSGISNDFLGELFPGVGAINTQAWYNQTNQVNARNRMNAGDSPNQIINWLVANDVSAQPELRQYGIVRLINGSPVSAGHTGTATDDYKNHITGPGYAIQGNILSGQAVLDSMEARFLREEGSLACKLMAALQGANTVGSDSRCAANGTSSLFAFVKVSQPTDVFGSPSFLVSVRTHANAGIEPIDSLQILFNNVMNCSGTNPLTEGLKEEIAISPNPGSGWFTIESKTAYFSDKTVLLFNATGQKIEEYHFSESLQLDMRSQPPGIYWIKVIDGDRILSEKIIKL